jgi:hypothetical protein
MDSNTTANVHSDTLKGSIILKGCTCTITNGTRIMLTGGCDGKNLQLQTESAEESADWAAGINKHITFADENDYLLT